MSVVNTVRTGVTPSQGVQPGSPLIIFETDWGQDQDDVTDAWLLNCLANLGQATILGVVSCTDDPNSAPGLRAVLDHWGRTSTPVVAYQGAYSPAMTTVYSSVVVTAFRAGDGRSTYQDATSGIRQLLAQSTGPVTYVSVGPPNVLAGVMNSTPDGWTTATGIQLLTSKCAQLVWAAGVWPTDAGAPAGFSPEFNLSINGCATNAKDVVTNWPVGITFAGIEMAGMPGSTTSATQLSSWTCSGFGTPPVANAGTNPTYTAWNNAHSSWLTPAGLRNSWGNMAVLYGVRGLSTMFAIATSGTATVTSSGHNTFTSGAGSHQYLKLAVAASDLQATISSLQTPLITSTITVKSQ